MVVFANTLRGGLVVALGFVAACATDAAESGRKPSVKEAEAALVKMFSDAAGKAEFTCAAGDRRHDYVCQGRYVPIDRTQPVFTQRIGASLSHYFEGEPVFAIVVLRDGAAKK